MKKKIKKALRIFRNVLLAPIHIAALLLIIIGVLLHMAAWMMQGRKNCSDRAKETVNMFWDE